MFNPTRNAAQWAAREAIDNLWSWRLSFIRGDHSAALDWTLATIQAVQALETRVRELESELDQVRRDIEWQRRGA